MPLNNPGGRIETNGGGTVFIDTTSISGHQNRNLSQDLNTLFGLSINSSHINSLSNFNDHQTNDASKVQLGSTNQNLLLEEATAMDTSESLAINSQNLEMRQLTEEDKVLRDIGLLAENSEFIPIVEDGDEVDPDTLTEKCTPLAPLSQTPQEMQHPVVSSSKLSVDNSSLPATTHILKTSSGQFIVLQPNQTCSASESSSSSSGNKIFSSSNLIFSSNSSHIVPKNVKSVLTNANKTTGSAFKQPGVGKPVQAQFRTLQLKQPISLASNAQSNAVTKVILTSQPGSGLGQQLRLITSQANINAPSLSKSNNSIGVNPTTIFPTSSKVTLQLQSLGLPVTTAKSTGSLAIQSELNNLKSGTKFKIPISTKSISSPVVSQLTNLQTSNEFNTNQAIGQVESKVSSVGSNNPTSIVIKGNVSHGTNVSALKTGQIISSSNAQLIKIPASQLQQLASTNQFSTGGSGAKVNLRLVSNSIVADGNLKNASQNTTGKPVLIPAATASATNISENVQTNAKVFPIHISQMQKQQRVIIPVTSQATPVVSGSSTAVISAGGVQLKSQSSGATTTGAFGVLSNAQPGSLVMIPAQFFQNSSLSSNVIHPSNAGTFQMTGQAVVKVPPHPKTVIDANVIKPRKPCNCTKSQCLKLYCDCFANGEFCNNCNCVNCFNNLTHEDDRQKAIRCCLERNPQAFRPKIGKGGTDAERRHNKGCNCKRSGCLKNYCECYEAKIPCSNMCKCIGCRNMDGEHPFERLRLMELAEAAEARVQQHSVLKTRVPISLSLPSPTKMSFASSSAKGACCRISQEVVEATCHCLLAQAEKVEKGTETSAQNMELKVLNEFSRCLLQIIGFNSKVKSSVFPF